MIIENLGDFNVLVRFFGWMDQRRADFAKVRGEAIRRIKSAFDRCRDLHARTDTDRPAGSCPGSSLRNEGRARLARINGREGRHGKGGRFTGYATGSSRSRKTFPPIMNPIFLSKHDAAIKSDRSVTPFVPCFLNKTLRDAMRLFRPGPGEPLLPVQPLKAVSYKRL